MSKPNPNAQAAFKNRSDERSVPNDNESHVRLSPAGELLRDREQLADFFRKRLSLDLRTQQNFHLVDYREEGEGHHPVFPTLGQVCDSFSEEDLGRVMTFQKPALLVVSDDRANHEYLAAIRRHHVPGAYVGSPYKTVTDQLLAMRTHYLSHQPKIGTMEPQRVAVMENGEQVSNPFTDQAQEHGELAWGIERGFTPYFVEAPRAVKMSVDDPADSSLIPLLRRMELKMQAREPNEGGMTAKLYAHLAMQAIERRGEMIDRNTFTVLDGESVVDGRLIPVGHCQDKRVTLDWVETNTVMAGRARFRKVLRGMGIVVF